MVADTSESDGQKATYSEGLVDPLRQAIQLGMVPRAKAHCSPQGPTECSPNLQGELGSWIRDNVPGETLEAEHMLHRQVASLS